MLRRAALLAATTLAALLPCAPAAAAPDGPAAAPAARVTTFEGSNCPQDSLCLYRDYGFKGGGIALRAGDTAPWLGDLGFNDLMSSWSNDSGVVCHWTSDAYGGGDSHVMRNGYRVNVLSRENDTASAVYC
ncbi:peptidase inhibitor family I36 protein [Streptomyces globosus]